MVADREPLNIKKYVAVGLLTLLIFSLGITIGLLLEQARNREIKYENQIQDVNYNSLQLQSLFLSTLEANEESCGVLTTTLQQSVEDLRKSLEKVTVWEKDATISGTEIHLLKREYTLDNIKYWIFATKNKETCNVDMITILYFFSNKDCEICPDQGVILSYYKEVFGERLLVFPIDIDLASEEPMIQLLMSKFNVTDLTKPVIIIESERYEGVVSTDDLGNIICKLFTTEQPECPDIVK